jgi:hypothetical protein
MGIAATIDPLHHPAFPGGAERFTAEIVRDMLQACRIDLRDPETVPFSWCEPGGSPLEAWPSDGVRSKVIEAHAAARVELLAVHLNAISSRGRTQPASPAAVEKVRCG